MKSFTYHRADTVDEAIALSRKSEGARFLGGGTNIVDLMRENIAKPDSLVDVSGLSREIHLNQDGALLIGAAARNTAVAEHPLVRRHYPMLSRAILSGASGQIRNVATVGGNLLQRTRCLYFYDEVSRCNKRQPGSGCDAIDGFSRMHAILGASSSCVATHPSDMCVALAALDAIVHVEGVRGRRVIPLIDFHRLPGNHPEIETSLEADELITAVEIPSATQSRTGIYRKVRDRASYAFALVSVAAQLKVEDGRIVTARIALGGVAHKPWRALAAEQRLEGRHCDRSAFAEAASAELADARLLSGNAFKLTLAKNMIVAALCEAGDC